MLFKGSIDSKVKVLGYVIVGLAFLGLVGWNANLQRRLGTERETTGQESTHVRVRRAGGTAGSNPSSTPLLGGATFVRWGRRDCPNDQSELVYSGIAGGSFYNEQGGSAEYICLPRDPQYASYTDALEGGARIYGVEYEIGGGRHFDMSKAPAGNLHNSDVVCVVCRSKSRASQVMVPARKECYPGWNKEYWGYLMTGHYDHKAQHNWACVDYMPEVGEKGARDDNGGLMYHVQGVCGSLPCPNYVNGRELTCVVCTK